MTTTRIGAPFQDVLSKVQNARVLSDEKGVDPFRGEHTDRKYDMNGDGVADARLIEAKKGAATHLELSFLDAKGRPVDTFVSGTKDDRFFGALTVAQLTSIALIVIGGAVISTLSGKGTLAPGIWLEKGAKV